MAQKIQLQLGEGESAASAELNYDRVHVKLPPMTLSTPLIEVEIEQPASQREIIVGSLTVNDSKGKEIAVMRFTEEGLRLSMSVGDSKIELPIRRPAATMNCFLSPAMNTSFSILCHNSHSSSPSITISPKIWSISWH